MAKKKKAKLTKEERQMQAAKERARLKQEVKEHPVLAGTYIVLRMLVIAVMVLQIFNREWYDVFLCGLTLFLFLIPSFVERRLHIDVPNVLEVIILLFIFSAEILGEISEYYLRFPFWDTALHTLNGFLMAAIGLAMVDILNRSRKFRIRLSPVFVAVVAFCFSMTIGVLWEFFEYGMDVFFRMDMKKDTYIPAVTSVLLNPDGRNAAVTVPVESILINGEAWPGYIDIGLHDTMKDLLVNFIGAVVFSFIGMLYIMGRGRGKFAPNFIPRLKEHELPVPKAEEEPNLLTPIPIEGPEDAENQELFDIYTRDGRPTGRTAPRGAALDKDDFRLGVHVFLYDAQGRFLVQKRAETKRSRPGQWDITMGHATAGESAIECVLREVREELGLELVLENLVKAYRWLEKGPQMFTDVFFARIEPGSGEISLQKEEVSEIKWLSKAEMLQFIEKLPDRPVEYKYIVSQYMESCIGESAGESSPQAKEDCVFCKIVAGEAPCYKIYEDESVLAFLDIAMDAPGHTLVIPKEHQGELFASGPETSARLIEAVRLISRHYVEDCGYDGVNILNASGTAAQQSVPHLHFHILPRKKGDGLNTWPSLGSHKTDLAAMQKKLTMIGQEK